MGDPGKTGPMGPAGPAGSSNPTPAPTPTLVPLSSGTQTLNIWNLSGATINVLIDGIAPSPASVGPSNSPCVNETQGAYSVTTGGHIVTLSMDSTDGATWGFVNVTYTQYEGGSFGALPPFFPSTNTITVNVNIAGSYGSHGVNISCYDDEISSPINSFVDVF